MSLVVCSSTLMFMCFLSVLPTQLGNSHNREDSCLLASHWATEGKDRNLSTAAAKT